MSEIVKLLSKIQKELKVPKAQYNKFGDYNYRSLEDIVETVKPMLPENAALVISDEVVGVGDRVYVKATATLQTDEESIFATGYAREGLERKKMHPEQLTGSASSYARNYACNGLFCLDDTKDADREEPPKPEKSEQEKPEQDNKDAAKDWLEAAAVKLKNFQTYKEETEWNKTDVIGKMWESRSEKQREWLTKNIQSAQERTQQSPVGGK